MSIAEFLEHISEKPWSAYTAADYTIEQWHAACLIHLHQGPPTSKNQCKLPVKTPNGALNRNGVHAATAALHGARTPLQAPPDQKAKAALALIRYYHQLGEKPPPSLVHSNVINSIIEHHGVKGQKWGVRKVRSAVSVGKLKSPQRHTERTVFQKSPKKLTTAELNRRIERMQMEKKYNELNKRDVGPGQKLAGQILHSSGTKVATALATAGLAFAVKVALEKRGGETGKGISALFKIHKK